MKGSGGRIVGCRELDCGNVSCPQWSNIGACVRDKSVIFIRQAFVSYIHVDVEVRMYMLVYVRCQALHPHTLLDVRTGMKACS